MNENQNKPVKIMDVNTYKLELQLTEEQVRELEKALNDRQDACYRDQIMNHNADTFKKFKDVSEVVNQFNEFLVENKLF